MLYTRHSWDLLCLIPLRAPDFSVTLLLCKEQTWTELGQGGYNELMVRSGSHRESTAESGSPD